MSVRVFSPSWGGMSLLFTEDDDVRDVRRQVSAWMRDDAVVMFESRGDHDSTAFLLNFGKIAAATVTNSERVEGTDVEWFLDSITGGQVQS